ncbi:MAG TPA: hypothetical protein VMT42_04725 [candidate division Zixibacteria bacterium]|nr:hypothetical protein [candidate division Zixibacteria bacterium]
MSDIKPNETKPKKVVRRSVAIVLAITCLGLLAGLVYVTVQMVDLSGIVDLRKSEVWVDNEAYTFPPIGETNWLYTVDYSGYVTVQVKTSTNTTYVEVVYTFMISNTPYGVYYDKRVYFDPANEEAVFPVLPLKNHYSIAGRLEIRVGNSDPLNNATVNITMIYYY